MTKENITIKQINEIQKLGTSCDSIDEWKDKMKKMAKELGLTDKEILEIGRGDIKLNTDKDLANK